MPRPPIPAGLRRRKQAPNRPHTRFLQATARFAFSSVHPQWRNGAHPVPRPACRPADHRPRGSAKPHECPLDGDRSALPAAWNMGGSDEHRSRHRHCHRQSRQARRAAPGVSANVPNAHVEEGCIEYVATVDPRARGQHPDQVRRGHLRRGREVGERGTASSRPGEARVAEEVAARQRAHRDPHLRSPPARARESRATTSLPMTVRSGMSRTS